MIEEIQGSLDASECKQVSIALSTTDPKSYDLGAAYRHVRMWLSTGASPIIFSFGDSTPAAATGNNMDASMGPLEFHFDSDGCRYIYAAESGSVGSINFLAWN